MRHNPKIEQILMILNTLGSMTSQEIFTSMSGPDIFKPSPSEITERCSRAIGLGLVARVGDGRRFSKFGLTELGRQILAKPCQSSCRDNIDPTPLSADQIVTKALRGRVPNSVWALAEAAAQC